MSQEFGESRSRPEPRYWALEIFTQDSERSTHGKRSGVGVATVGVGVM